MDNSNFRFYFLRDQKLKNKRTYQSASENVEPILSKHDTLPQQFPQKSVVRIGKNKSAIFHSRPHVKDTSWMR